MSNIISDWLKKHGDLNTRKEVEVKLENIMKNEELKQEAIKKAWVELIDEEVFNDHITFIRNNGWYFNGCPRKLLFDAPEELFEKHPSRIDWEIFRPKSLSGIEDNNGWIRILEDGSNLPESGEYKLLYKNGEIETTEIMQTDYFNKDWILKFWTHYKPIELEKLPIY